MGSPIDLTLGSCSTHIGLKNNGYLTNYDIRKAEEHLRSLEEERRKVEGFKRELPSCIQLLENAIHALKENLDDGKGMPTLQLSCTSMDSAKERNDAVESRPTLEEFLPLNRRWGAPSQGKDVDTEGSLMAPRGIKRPAWMTEAQLWSQNSTSTEEVCHEKEKEQEPSSVTSSQLLLACKERSTGAFLPYEHSDVVAPLVSRPTPTMARSGVGLSLSFGEPITSTNSSKAVSDSEAGSIDVGFRTPDVGMVSNGTSGAGTSDKVNPAKRKARRCWSPELHRRFTSALHQLGGAEVATPKQICELMKVDGLTNDEVKSHLQKYRLHTRRSSPSPQPAAEAQPPQLVVLGGIWVPPKCTLSASQPPPGVYDSSTQHPSQFYQPPALPQGQYFACISNGTSGAPPVQMHRQPIFDSQQAASQSHSSPQGSLQVTSQLLGATQGPNSEVYHDESGEEEDEEEAKSDSTSWKIENYNGEELKKSGSEFATDNVHAEV